MIENRCSGPSGLQFWFSSTLNFPERFWHTGRSWTWPNAFRGEETKNIRIDSAGHHLAKIQSKMILVQRVEKSSEPPLDARILKLEKQVSCLLTTREATFEVCDPALRHSQHNVPVKTQNGIHIRIRTSNCVLELHLGCSKIGEGPPPPDRCEFSSAVPGEPSSNFATT